MSTEVIVTVIPDCDICKSGIVAKSVPAAVDGKTLHGPWAYMCEQHFATMGTGLGTGRGQRLKLKPQPVGSIPGTQLARSEAPQLLAITQADIDAGLADEYLEPVVTVLFPPGDES